MNIAKPSTSLTQRSTQRRVHSQKGGIFIILLILTPIAAVVFALVIDVQARQVSHRDVQSLVDSAAMAAANTLDGTAEGWVRAKRAALLVVKQSKDLPGYKGPRDSSTDTIAPGLTLTSGPHEIHPLGDGSDINGTKGSEGNLEIEIERGVYWQNTSQEFEFRSFEEISPDQEQSYGAYAFIIANAVRVTLTLDDMKTNFSAFTGTDELGEVKARSLAVTRNEAEVCALPVGIPLCALMREWDSENSQTIDWDRMNNLGSGFWDYAWPISNQYRDIFAVEANVDNPDRMEGLTRALSYVMGVPSRVNHYGLVNDCYATGGSFRANSQSCKAGGSVATFGVPAGLDESIFSPSTPSEVGAVLQQADPAACVPVKVGYRFRPLEDAVTVDGDPIAGLLHDSSPTDINPMEANLRSMINNGDGFTSGVDIDYTATGGGGSLNVQYPPVRGGTCGSVTFQNPSSLLYPIGSPIWGLIGVDQCYLENWDLLSLLSWPKQNDKHGFIRPSPKGEGIFRGNPACHTTGVNPGGTAYTNIMIIAPDDGSTNYCDDNASRHWLTPYWRPSSNGGPPTIDTNPVVVGYLRVWLTDFQFNRFDDDDTIQAFGSDTGESYAEKLRDDNASALVQQEINFTADAAKWATVMGHLYDRLRLYREGDIDHFFNGIHNYAGCTNCELKCHANASPSDPKYYDCTGIDGQDKHDELTNPDSSAYDETCHPDFAAGCEGWEHSSVSDNDGICSPCPTPLPTPAPHETNPCPECSYSTDSCSWCDSSCSVCYGMCGHPGYPSCDDCTSWCRWERGMTPEPTPEPGESCEEKREKCEACMASCKPKIDEKIADCEAIPAQCCEYPRMNCADQDNFGIPIGKVAESCTSANSPARDCRSLPNAPVKCTDECIVTIEPVWKEDDGTPISEPSLSAMWNEFKKNVLINPDGSSSEVDVDCFNLPSTPPQLSFDLNPWDRHPDSGISNPDISMFHSTDPNSNDNLQQLFTYLQRHSIAAGYRLNAEKTVDAHPPDEAPEQANAKLFSVYGSDWGLPTRSDKNCLPYSPPGANPRIPDEWEFRHLKPQYLCGGLRMISQPIPSFFPLAPTEHAPVPVVVSQEID